MSNSNLGSKRFRDHDLYPLIVSVAITLVCGGVIWIVLARLP